VANVESAMALQSPPMTLQLQLRTRRTAAATYALFVVFGVGSWVTVNAMFTELPLLVATAPEGWRLASVLALTVQFANVGPLAFYVARRWALHRYPETGDAIVAAVTTYVVLGLGALAMGALVFCWDATWIFGGTEHSAPLIALTFLAAFADCTSSLVFWRFAGGFRPLFVSALAAGEGTSGVVSSALAWLQNASNEQPRFSPSVYFALLAGVMLCSLAAFHALRCAPFALAERMAPSSDQPSADADDRPLAGAPPAMVGAGREGDLYAALCGKASAGIGGAPGESAAARPLHSASALGIEADMVGQVSTGDVVRCESGAGNSRTSSVRRLSREAIWLLMLQAWLNVLQNGVAVSCLSLAAQPYGRGAYQVAQTVSLFVDPLAAALGFRLRAGAWVLLPVALAVTAAHGYILALSLVSVTPPLTVPEGSGFGAGAQLLVLVVAVGRALTSYSKMRVNVLLQEGAHEDGEYRLMVSGVAIQTGAFAGSLVMYLLINHTALFRGGS